MKRPARPRRRGTPAPPAPCPAAGACPVPAFQSDSVGSIVQRSVLLTIHFREEGRRVPVGTHRAQSIFAWFRRQVNKDAELRLLDKWAGMHHLETGYGDIAGLSFHLLARSGCEVQPLPCKAGQRESFIGICCLYESFGLKIPSTRSHNQTAECHPLPHH